MPTTRYLLKPECRRALELLAACPDGCTEAIMLAHGFSIDMMVELINSGLATLQTAWFLDDGYQGERARVRIAEAGRRAHCDRLHCKIAIGLPFSGEERSCSEHHRHDRV